METFVLYMGLMGLMVATVTIITYVIKFFVMLYKIVQRKYEGKGKREVKSLPEIIMIELGTGEDSSVWKVGSKAPLMTCVGWAGRYEVTEIKNVSTEFEDRIHVQYDIYAEGRLYISIINQPVTVFYDTKEGS